MQVNWQLFRNALVNTPDFHERPQLVARVDRAVREVKAGLEELASLGHTFHLAAGPAANAPEWPRLVYHLEKAPRGFLCLCQEDFGFLGGYDGGWHDTLEQAKYSAGMDRQFRGRGGVLPKRGLPAEAPQREPTRLDRLRLEGLLNAQGEID